MECGIEPETAHLNHLLREQLESRSEANGKAFCARGAARRADKQ